MKKYATLIQALDPLDGELKQWAGPPIEANSVEEARKFRDENGLGYCYINGDVIQDFETILHTPDMLITPQKGASGDSREPK
jgi:hypothetical protein